MARMKFLCDAERCIECNGCVTACKQENEVPWGVNRRRVVTLNDGVPARRNRSRSPACTARTRRAWRCARWTASTAPTRAWCCTTRTCASAAATASTPVRSARRSSRRQAPSACAARWTSARSAPAARRRTCPRRSSASTAPTAWRRASCPRAPKCARPRRCSPATPTSIADIFRHARAQARQGLGSVGLGHRLRQTRQSAGAAAEGAKS